MPIAIVGVKLFLIVSHGAVRLYVHSFIWRENLCSSSLLLLLCSVVLIATHLVKLYAHAIHGVKLYAHCYTWSEALCALLYMEWIYME